MKRIVIFLIVILNSIFVFSQSWTQPLPVEKDVLTDTLDNGLVYCVLHDPSETGKATFYLIQKTGALVEQEDEWGMAHYVEHMLFRGSKNLPEEGFNAFLQRNGLAIRQGSQAYTRFDNTQYILTTTGTSRELADTCLLLLREMAANATISDEGVEHERNIIIEEWRLRKNPQEEYLLKKIFADTPYDRPSLIGDTALIRTFSAAQLRSFYKRWYQPQMQGIIAVGDIDAEHAEKKIRELFCSIPRGEAKVPDPVIFPDYEEPRAIVVKQKNAIKAHITHINPFPRVDASRLNTVGGYVDSHLGEKMAGLILNRYYMRMRDYPEIDLLLANIADYLVTTGTQMYSVTAITNPKQWEKALTTMERELERIHRFGFHPDKTSTDGANDSIATNPNDTINFNAVVGPEWENAPSMLVEHILHGAPCLTRETANRLQSFLDYELSTAYADTRYHQIVNRCREAIILTIPDNEAYTVPTEEDVLNIVRKVRMEELEPYKEETKKDSAQRKDTIFPPDEADPVPGKIFNQKSLNWGYTELQLSNGVTVLLHPRRGIQTMHIDGFRPGGKSLFDNDELPSVALLCKGQNAYGQKYEGEMFGTIMMEDFSDRYHFICNSKEKNTNDSSATLFPKAHLHEAFNTLYCKLTHTEIDTADYEKKRNEMAENALIKPTPIQKFLSMMGYVTRSSYDREEILTPEYVEAITLQGVEAADRKRKANYNGLVLSIDGDFDTDSILPFVEKYIGGLPAKRKASRRIDRPEYHIKNHNDSTFIRFVDDKPSCIVSLSFQQQKKYKYNETQHAHHRVLTGLLQQLLLSRLRLETGDVYTVQLSSQESHYYHPLHSYVALYSCDPDKRCQINAKIKQLMNEIATDEIITQEMIDDFVYKEQSKPGAYKSLHADLSSREMISKRENGGYLFEKRDIESLNIVTSKSLKKYVRNLLRYGYVYELVLEGRLESASSSN